jgi:hypothetical protein
VWLSEQPEVVPDYNLLSVRQPLSLFLFDLRGVHSKTA